MLLKIIFKPIQWLWSLLLGLVLFVLVAVALAGFYVPFIAEKFVSYRTDFPLHIGNSHMNLFLGEVDIWDMDIKNPTRFHEPFFVKLKELSLHVSPLSLLQKTKLIERVVIDIPEITWVRTATGEVNVDAFVDALTGGAEEGKTSSEKEKSSSATSKTTDKEADAFHINSLVIRLGKLKRVDYSNGKANIRDYELNLDLELKDVRGAQDIIGPLTLALSKSGVAFLTNSLKDLGGLPINQLSNHLEKGANAIINTTSDLLGTVKSLF